MPTTTNYGWTTPADTDLVKDGASAIRTLGSSIDTTVFNNANAAIAKSLVDAKGDLIVGSANDSVARLAVGATNGHVLKVNSAATNGIEWGAVPEPSSNWTLITSGRSTTGSSVSLSVSGYNKYIVHFGIYSATTGVTMKWRFNNLSASNYQYGAAMSGAGISTQTNVDGINLDNFSTFNDQPSGFLEINNANSSGKPQFFGSWRRANNANNNLITYSGLYNANINLSSIDLVSTATIDQFDYRVWGQ